MTAIPGPGWYPVAASSEISTDPRAVDAGGLPFTAFRSRAGGPASVVAPRCPHRLVRLQHASVVGGRLRCPYHGWEFGPDGVCALVPSLGPDAAPPPRADLGRPWGVREQDGVLWVAPRDPDVEAGTVPSPTAEQDVFGNLEPALEHAWHPVALLRELPVDGALDVRLLGRSWTLFRSAAGLHAGSSERAGPRAGSSERAGPRAGSSERAGPRAGSSERTRRHVGAELPAEAPFGVVERYGMVWLAPRDPRVGLLDAPDDDDPAFGGDWLPPERTASAAGLMADNFLDVAHFPFVHAGTFGAAEEPLVSSYDVEPEPGGFRSVQEQWFDNPEDPGVAAGERQVRQRRRVTYTYRVPFQLSLRMQELDAGAVKTILFFLQPEDERSTRIYTKLLLHGVGGAPVPAPDVLRREIDFEVAVLAEDLALQQAMGATGLPLTLRDELHVRADRCGVALRRALAAFRAG